jgi:NAD+ diphosphatase
MSSTTPATAVPPLGPLALARSAVDRGCERRGADGLIEDLWGKPGTKVMYIAGGKTPVRDNRLLLLDTAGRRLPALPVYLGRTLDGSGSEPAGTEIVLAALPAPAADSEVDDAAADAEWLGLREVALGLSPRDAGLFVEAAAIANWHATHTHCPRCGHRTEPEQGGWVRRCPADSSEHYPRTDPAIIVTVVDEQDRLLLGSSKQWAGNRYSTLAGFVEPGESLEAAVIREVAEESGIEVHSPQYMGSQPWPFPCSLMVGFTAQASSTETRPDGVEIVDVRWFTRAELAQAVASGEIRIASGISIARSLIEHWYGGPLAEAAAEVRPQ